MTRVEEVRETIEAALAKKAFVAMLYHGGSNSGGYREILPLKVTATGKLRAKCMTSNAVKSFVFDSIELVPFQTPET